MELKDSERVVNEIEIRLDEMLLKKYPMAAKMVPAEIKAIVKEALSGAYASGFCHGMKFTIEANQNGTAK
jgi:hypothetical protein